MNITKLAWTRKLRGLSQGQLAKLAGVSVKCIQHAEQRYRSIDNMSAHNLYRIASVLEVPMESLLEHEFEEAVIPQKRVDNNV